MDGASLNIHFGAGVSGATVAGGVTVIIDGNGHLGTVVSSERFKDQIKPMDKTSEAILRFKPATFHYKGDNTNRPEFGLIAEEVAEVNPDLIVGDRNGEILSVRDDAVNAMMLNEFLKRDRKVRWDDATHVKWTGEKTSALRIDAGLERGERHTHG